jgi:hypothetical protein
VTRIVMSPLVQNPSGKVPARASLTVTPTFLYKIDGDKVIVGQPTTWEFAPDRNAAPSVLIDKPDVNSGWRLELNIGPTKIIRTVAWTSTADAIDWGDLPDVDPDTLDVIPPSAQLVQWTELLHGLQEAQEPGPPGPPGVVLASIHMLDADAEPTVSVVNGLLSLGVPQGTQGVQGEQGDVGPKGDQGDVGPKGDKGDAGPASTVPGPQGEQGDTGPKGDKGDTGPASTVPGPQGDTGPKGDKGDTGDVGPKGDKGDTGSTGPAGSVARPAARIYRAPGAADVYYGTGGTGADVLCPSTAFNDSTSFFDLTTNAGKIKVLQAGLYQISARLRTDADGGAGLRDCRVTRNGTTVFESGCYTNNTVVIPSASDTLRLAANDVIGLNGYASTATVVRSAVAGTDVVLTVAYIGS